MSIAARNRWGTLVLGVLVAGAVRQASGQSIQTIVGGGSNDGRLATGAALTPTGLAVSPSGDVFIADPTSQRVWRIDHATGTIATYAGNGIPSYTGDGGPATKATIYNPYGLALDAAGNLYIADASNCAVRRVEAGTGLISSVVGGSDAQQGGDGGPATKALVCSRAVALDAAGNLFIADTSGNRVRRVDKATGILTTIAGDGSAGSGGDGGPATRAQLRVPQGIAADPAGNVFVADTDNQRMRRIDVRTGVITTAAGTGEAGYSGDGGPATQAQLAGPTGIFLDAAGRLFISDFGYRIVRKVEGGSITTVAGNGDCCSTGDGGPATRAALHGPVAVAVAGGDLYIGDLGARLVRKVTGQTGLIQTISGVGKVTFLGDGGPATAAAITQPFDVAYDAGGNLYIAENNRIRKVAASTGVITTIAGTDDYRFVADDVPATTATLFSPAGVTVDRLTGDVYISDTYDDRIRRVSAATGLISTVAGSGEPGFSGDGGPATAARLSEPYDVELGAGGVLYIADHRNHRVRRVALATGLITTIAGNGTASGPAGDGGPATLAVVAQPAGLALDGQGNLLIAEYDGERIRRMNLATGTITTLAGDGQIGGGIDIPASQARLYRPGGLAVDAAGNIYLTEAGGSDVKRIDVTSGVITAIAGPARGFSGDNGPASAAEILFPRSLTLDPAGNIVLADTGNNRIRRISACLAVTAPTLLAPTPGTDVDPTTARLSWTAVPGAFRFDVYLGTEETASTLLVPDLTSTSVSLANLLPDTRYFWRVVAKGDPFCTPFSTAASAVRSFTTTGGCAVPGAFAGTAPADAATVTSPVTLTWQASSGAGSYDVYLGGSSPPPLADSGLTATSFSPQGLVPGSSYVWNVIAHASCDAARTAASPLRTFRIAGGCAAPGTFGVTAPSGGTSGVASSTTISWSPSANATAYDLYLGTETTPPLYLTGLTATSANVTGLAAGATYRARVVARTSCDDGLTAQTPLVTFTVAGTCVAPGPTTFSFVPATVGSGQSYVVVWKDAPNLGFDGSYIVERSLSPGFSPLLDSQQVSRTSATFLAKGAGTLHHRVRAAAGCDPAKTGPVSDVRSVAVVAASPNVIFTVQPQAVITALGEPLEERKTSFTLENISEAPLQILLGRLELSPSVPFFYLVDPLGGDTAFVTLEPRKPKSFDVRFSGPSNAKEGAYQGLVFASSTGQGLAITPYAFVNLKVGDSDSSAPEIRFCASSGACTATEYVAFPGFAGDDRVRPAIEIDVKNPGTTPMQLGAEIGPEVWLALEPGWNATPIAPGASRRVKLSTNRSRAPAGSALPRYTYLTLRARGGQTARLLVQDNDLPRLASGRAALASRSQRSYLVPSVVNATSRIGNSFVSRVRLSNAGSQDVQAELLFTPSGADGFDGNAVRSATVVVPRNDLVNLTDPLVQLFGLTPPIAGTLEIRADADRIGFLTVTSLVDAAARTGGSFGFQLPTLQRGEGARLGSGHLIPGITASAAYRTNLILAETTGIEETRVKVALFDAQGVKLGETEQTVARYGQLQVSGVVAALGGGETQAAASLEIDVVSGGGAVAGLVTVIDNVNDDAVTYVGQPERAAAPAVRASRRPRWALATGTLKSVVPAIVSGFRTFPGTDKPYTFRSQMGFVAARAQPATFRLTYVDLSTGQSHVRTVTVEPRKTVEYQNVVEQLFGLPAGAPSQGPVLVESDGGGILYCKVYSGTDAGSLGDTFPVVPVPGESLTGGSSQITLAVDGLEQSTDGSRGTRSNLILNEVLGEETAITISVYEAGNRSVPIAETDITLRPLEKVQLSTVFSGVGLNDDIRRKDRTNVLLVLRPRSGRGLVSGVVTTIDNKTGDTKNSLLTPGGGTPATGGSIGF